MTRTLVEHDARSLPDDVEQLKTLVLDLLEHTRGLEHRLQLLLRQRFGPSAERIDPDQLKLFAKEILEAGAAETAEPATTTIPEHARRNGRRKLPEDLPRIRVEHDLTEEKRACPCCGEQRRKIGEETSQASSPSSS